MNSINTKIYGKLNLSLNVCGRRGGMHIVDTVMCGVDVFDNIRVGVCGGSGVEVRFLGDCGVDRVDNTAYAMAKLLQREYNLGGMEIDIVKGIPIKAGLGGSAADAAGVLLSVDKLYGLGLTVGKMRDIGLQVGADVPYMCLGGIARQDDRVGTLVPLVSQRLGLIVVVLLIGKDGVSTKECFAQFDNFYRDSIYAPSDNDCLQKAIVDKDIDSIYRHIDNALTIPACHTNQTVYKSLQLLKSTGAKAVSMSGSGSACFGIYDETMDTRVLVKKLKENSSFCFCSQI